jgi:lysyl-tRNA synthetase, class II
MASLEEIRKARLEKLELLKSQGVDPYPVDPKQEITVLEAGERFNELEEGKSVYMVGRILSLREQGKLIFLDFDDGTGRFQALLRKGEPTSEEAFELFEKAFDIGDFIELKGTLFLTKSSQKTILVEDLRMLSKSLRPLPEKWHGLQDVEMRFRERELDILSDPEVKERFVVRSKVVSSMRRFLDDKGFLEFETPVLQTIPGGANARPFVTHHNALDIDLYLRIATEIHLKRLIVAGYPKVYEIGRLFRNEGIDHAHNPEFTTLEMYWAYVGKEEYLSFLEGLMKHVVQSSVGSDKIPYKDTQIDFSEAWPRLTFREAVLEASGIDIDTYSDTAELEKAVKEKGLDVDFSNAIGLAEYFDQLFKKTARAAITKPTWILDYPLPLKPLANRSPDDSTKSASAQLIIHGDEIINTYYHELHDPIDQRERFIEQEKFREEGSEEAQRIDEQFIKSLEYGMPPTSGVGIGIDRLVMLLTNTENVKEVIAFPTLRPKE